MLYLNFLLSSVTVARSIVAFVVLDFSYALATSSSSPIYLSITSSFLLVAIYTSSSKNWRFFLSLLSANFSLIVHT